jgi:hypothetical protein
MCTYKHINVIYLYMYHRHIALVLVVSSDLDRGGFGVAG